MVRTAAGAPTPLGVWAPTVSTLPTMTAIKIARLATMKDTSRRVLFLVMLSTDIPYPPSRSSLTSVKSNPPPAGTNWDTTHDRRGRQLRPAGGPCSSPRPVASSTSCQPPRTGHRLQAFAQVHSGADPELAVHPGEVGFHRLDTDEGRRSPGDPESRGTADPCLTGALGRRVRVPSWAIPSLEV